MKNLKIFIALLLIYTSSIYNCSAQVCFPASNFAVGSNPYSATCADFNGDGKMDIVTGNNNGVSILIGNGAGGFSAATNFAAGSTLISVTNADFNGDGKMDIATANNSNGSNDVSILIGNGVGGFSKATNFAVGTLPHFITSADFNGDGKIDVVTANAGSNDVSVLIGNGAGSFDTATSFAVGINPFSVTNVDFNGDGKMDLATANYGSNNVSILIGNGAGSFDTATNFVVGTNPYSISSADFNGDGKMDIVTANKGSNNTSILIGNGAGSFSTATNFVTGISPISITSADFNGDGEMDIATANYSDSISVLTGNGAGSFGVANSFEIGRAYASPPYTAYSITNADFNGDGKMDIATANYYSKDVSVLIGQKQGQGTSIQSITPAIVNATCNGSDGSCFVSVSSSNSNPVSYLWSNGGTSNQITGLSPGTYSVTVQQSLSGCNSIKTASVTIDNSAPPSTDTVCFVTVDSNSTHNIIIWEKPASTSADSFAVYREVSTNVYSKIGTMSYNSLSEFHDYGANPNVTSYKYKMKVVDKCGHESNFCNYHNTINLQSSLGLNGVVNFQWTAYSIESQSNPVSYYSIYRDNTGTGNFQPISSTIPGSNTTYTDINAAAYPNARYYIEAVWGRSCTPQRSASSTTRSNIKSATTTGISQNNIDNIVVIYPNPAATTVTITLSDIAGAANLTITNVLGETVFNQTMNGKSKTINTENFTKGIYTVIIKNSEIYVSKKLIIN